MSNLAILKKKLQGQPQAINASGMPINAVRINPVATAAQVPPAQTPWEIHKAKMEEICKQLRDERNRQGMTQRDLAAKSGMSQGTITRAERHGWISISALIRIADGLGKKITLN